MAHQGPGIELHFDILLNILAYKLAHSLCEIVDRELGRKAIFRTYDTVEARLSPFMEKKYHQKRRTVGHTYMFKEERKEGEG